MTTLSITVEPPIILQAVQSGLSVFRGADGDAAVTLGEYAYHAASTEEDTTGDWRQYADANGFYTQYCTAGNATKGGGTWETKFTIQK